MKTNGGLWDFKGRTRRSYTGGLLETRFDLTFDPILCDAFLPVGLKSNLQGSVLAHSVPFYLQKDEIAWDVLANAVWC